MTINEVKTATHNIAVNIATSAINSGRLVEVADQYAQTRLGGFEEAAEWKKGISDYASKLKEELSDTMILLRKLGEELNHA